MTPTELRETFIDRPEFLLALMFSTPDVPADEILSSITVDFTEAEVVARVRRRTDDSLGATFTCDEAGRFSQLYFFII